MCGRYAIYITKEEIETYFDVESDKEDLFNPNYNVAPGSFNPVVIEPKPSLYGVELLRWGLVPKWTDDPNIGYKMINARSETLTEKPSFKNSFKRRRCLIPANGFYEWQKIGGIKFPYYIQPLETDLFAFAGLYEKWNDKTTGEPLWTYTIITTTANDHLQPLHERMPVILEKPHFNEWLNPLNSDTDKLQRLLKPYPSEKIRLFRVSQDVNATKNNNSSLIQPVDV